MATRAELAPVPLVLEEFVAIISWTLAARVEFVNADGNMACFPDL